MLYLCSSLKETEDEGYFSNRTYNVFFERKGIESARFLLLLRFFLRLIPSFFFFEIIRIEETDGILFEIVLFFRGGNDGISLSGGREREIACLACVARDSTFSLSPPLLAMQPLSRSPFRQSTSSFSLPFPSSPLAAVLPGFCSVSFFPSPVPASIFIVITNLIKSRVSTSCALGGCVKHFN